MMMMMMMVMMMKPEAQFRAYSKRHTKDKPRTAGRNGKPDARARSNQSTHATFFANNNSHVQMRRSGISGAEIRSWMGMLGNQAGALNQP